MMLRAGLLLLMLVSGVVGCGERAPAGRILVKNDSLDKEYNVIVVQGGGVRFELKPFEKVLMPEQTTKLSFSRRYRDHTKFYEVTCPARSSSSPGVVLKMIDVHTARMQGGCTVVNAGRR